MTQDTPRHTTRDRLMHYGMMACCAVMLLPVAGILIGGGGLGGATGALAPLLLCLGAHLVMHKMMGKSCHGAAHGASETQPEQTAARALPAPEADARLG